MKERILLIILFLLLLSPLNTNATIKPTNNFYVNDFANILSEDTKNYIQKQIINFYACFYHN